MSPADDEKQRLAHAIRMLERVGAIDFNGHCSMRLAGERLLINSGRSVRSALAADDIVTIDFDGRLVEGSDPPPMEFHIHTEIYRRRPDAGAIVHAHPKWSTLFTMTGRRIEPVFPQGVLLGEMPVLPTSLSINTRDRGVELALTLADARAALLRSHGAVVTGADIVECFALTVYLEENAERQYRASALGEPHVISGEEARQHRANLWNRKLFEKVWEHHLARLR